VVDLAPDARLDVTVSDLKLWPQTRPFGGSSWFQLVPGLSDDERPNGGYDGIVRIGYARVSTRVLEHQAQLDPLAGAHRQRRLATPW
jgi:hypothetical protein